jgi:hypothetical protein
MFKGLPDHLTADAGFSKLLVQIDDVRVHEIADRKFMFLNPERELSNPFASVKRFNAAIINFERDCSALTWYSEMPVVTFALNDHVRMSTIVRG